MIFLFYSITVENFDELTFKIIIFYMFSYGTAEKYKLSRVFPKRGQIFDQYKIYDFKE